jgi:hypothetical protein
VARRRYGKSPAISTAGQIERPRDPSGDESLAQEFAPRTEYGKAEPAPEPASEPQHYSTGLGQQLHDMRQQQQADALNQYIAAYFPSSTLGERQWLHMNVHHLQNHHPAVIDKIAGVTLSRGVPRESPEFLRTVGQELDRLHAARMQPTPAPPMPPMPAHTHIDVEKTETPEGEPESTHMDAHFVSAPVSRSDSGHSIEPELSASTIRLTPAQREIANLPGGPGEVEYAKQLLKMQKAKKSGLIKD